MKAITLSLLAALNPLTARGLALLMPVAILASGCSSYDVTREGLMHNPQIIAIQGQMSEEKALAVLRRQIDRGQGAGFRANGYSVSMGDNGYSISVDRSGFVIKRALRIPDGTGFTFIPLPALVSLHVPGTPLPDRTVAFADVKNVHFLIKFYHLYASDGVFWVFNLTSKDKNEFLAALFFLCPNIQGH
jgi:hypothetical protein